MLVWCDRVGWDLAVIVVLLYNLIEIPVRLCFDSDPLPWSSADVFNLCTDIFFLLDVLVHFRTGFYEDEFYRVCT
jgi:hypothetical protein